MYLNSYFINLDVGHFFDTASNIANMNLNCPFCKVVQINYLRIRGQAGKWTPKESKVQINDMVAKGLVNE